MRRYLVVANQTLGTAQLQQELFLRAEAEHASFYFLVPNTPRADYASAWTGAAVVIDESDATQGAKERMRAVVAAMRERGATATGEIAHPDPLEAIKRRTRLKRYDEILVSTLPSRISRWLKMDLPSRVARAVSVPVTTVIAKEET